MTGDKIQKIVETIFNEIKEKYDFNDNQVAIYLQGYQDCATEEQQFLAKRDKIINDTLDELNEVKELLKLTYNALNNHSANNCFTCKHYNADSTHNSHCVLNDNDNDNECKWEWVYSDKIIKVLNDNT